MHVETLSYKTTSGWSVSPFPALDSEQTLVLVFGAPEFIDTPEPITELRKAYPKSCVIGCSTAGEILGTMMYDKTLSVAVVKFDHARVAKAGATVKNADDSLQAGKLIAEGLTKPDIRAVFVLSDGSNVNGSELVRGLVSGLPEGTTVTGGLAGDGPRFQRTWVMNDGGPETGIVVAVGFYGEGVSIGHGSKGGWDNFGLERTVTRSENNVLYELDGKPALALYKEYLGDLAEGLPATALLFPLALRANASDKQPMVRTILSIDEDAQSMRFAGDVPQGYRAQLMKANFDRLIDGAADAAAAANTIPPSDDALCIAISCIGRRLILGERIEEELEATLNALPFKAQQVGFYSYGEISPSGGGYCDLHNQTMTVTTISETDPAVKMTVTATTETAPKGA
jgi:hypothetical protein